MARLIGQGAGELRTDLGGAVARHEGDRPHSRDAEREKHGEQVLQNEALSTARHGRGTRCRDGGSCGRGREDRLGTRRIEQRLSVLRKLRTSYTDLKAVTQLWRTPAV